MIKPTYMIFYSLSSEVWTAIYKGIRLLGLGLCTKPIIHIYSPGLQENSSSHLATHFFYHYITYIVF